MLLDLRAGILSQDPHFKELADPFVYLAFRTIVRKIRDIANLGSRL